MTLRVIMALTALGGIVARDFTFLDPLLDLDTLAGRIRTCAVLRSGICWSASAAADRPFANAFTTYSVLFQARIHKTQAIAAFFSGIDSDAEKNKKGAHYIGDIGVFCGITRL